MGVQWLERHVWMPLWWIFRSPVAVKIRGVVYSIDEQHIPLENALKPIDPSASVARLLPFVDLIWLGAMDCGLDEGNCGFDRVARRLSPSFFCSLDVTPRDRSGVSLLIFKKDILWRRVSQMDMVGTMSVPWIPLLVPGVHHLTWRRRHLDGIFQWAGTDSSEVWQRRGTEQRDFLIELGNDGKCPKGRSI